MRKIITLVLGISLLGSGVFLLTSDASRYRPFSNRIGSYKQYIPTRTQVRHNMVSYTHPSLRPNTHLYKPYQKSIISYRDQKVLRRISSPELYPRYKNELFSGRNIVRNDDYKTVEGLVFDSTSDRFVFNNQNTNKIALSNTDHFVLNKMNSFRQKQIRKYYSIETPYNFKKQNGVYRSANTSLAFRITETPKGYQCNQLSFEMCAIDYRKQFVDDQQLILTSSIKKITTPRQTLKSSFVRIPTVSEAFYANGFGSKNVYFLFSAYNPKTGALVRVEGVANEKDAYSSAKTMEEVYQSFKFNY